MLKILKNVHKTQGDVSNLLILSTNNLKLTDVQSTIVEDEEK